MQKHFKQIFILLILGLILPQIIFAAEISFDVKTNTVALGQQFQVGTILNTSGEEINAVEGKIIFPSDLLGLKEIRDANSIINFWVEKPRETRDNKQGGVAFSGIIPGGYHGQNGLLFTLIFVSKQEGQGTVELQEAKTLLNDGNGTEASLATSPYQFIISKTVSAPAVSPVAVDKEPPESFVPEIGQNPVIANGKWFLVFATQDKGSGIDHYEVKETRHKKVFSIQYLVFRERGWKVAESPYILQDQELRSYIFVKAVDKAGNVRIEKISPQNPLSWYENYENWITILIVFSILYLVYRVWKRRRYNHLKI